jgi:formylglycine-generating enzyme required for sulfatase activity
MSENGATPRCGVFVSYSHKDRKYFDEFKGMLQPVIRDGRLEVWDDTRIRPGEDWRGEIRAAIESARIAVLLVSQPYLDSEFIAENELPPLLEAAEKEGLIIYWYCVSSALYEQTPIARYQAAHDVGRPLDHLTRPRRMALWKETCAKLIGLGSPGPMASTQPRAAHKAVGLAAPVMTGTPEPGTRPWAAKRRRLGLVIGLVAVILAAGSVASWRSRARLNEIWARLMRALQAPEALGMTFVRLTPGVFTMGSSPGELDRVGELIPSTYESDFFDERPAHTVRISKAFYLAAHEVTVGQFRQFTDATGYRTEAEQNGTAWGFDQARGSFRQDEKYSWKDIGVPQGDRSPVVNVSWNDAKAFCEWLTKREGGRWRYRLPTEAEWEYACRAGTTDLFLNGDDPEKLAHLANVADACLRRRFPNYATVKAKDGYEFAAPVGSFPENAAGLFDMIGNVSEWCEDGYGAKFYQSSPRDDPRGPSKSVERVIRGSSWYSNPRFCRPADRYGNPPEAAFYYLGFRVAAEGGR